MQWSKLLCEERIRVVGSNYKSGDLRTEFEKDYHRIVGSASFRRLQDKTQVFPLDKSDFIRTRLTHSLEVSSFAKSLGQIVSQQIINNGLDAEFGPKQKEDVCTILQCAGLIHDIGNPPFGHFGEDAIRDYFKENLPIKTFKGKAISEILSLQQKEDFYNFEGNTQALRVVTKLHFLVDENGMNLTKALLGTIIKYPVSSVEIDKKSGDIRTKKMGYYYADKDRFDNIQEALGTNGRRHPLTFILEAADDVAYKSADIEDAVKKSCISINTLILELKEFKEEFQGEIYKQMVEMLQKRYEQAKKRDVDNPESNAVANWVVGVQGKILQMAGEAFINNYESIMEGTYKYDLFHDTDAELIMDALGDIAYRYAFTSDPIYKLEIAADTIYNFLLDRFLDAIINFDTDEPGKNVDTRLIAQISDNYMKIYQIFSKDKSEEEKLYLRILLVTDYICGMTDTFAKNLYQEFNGII